MAEQAAAAVSAELATEADPAPAVAAVAVVEPDAPAPEPSFSAAVELSPEAFAELWPAVLESLQDEAPHLAAVLQSAHPASVDDGELTLAWPETAGFFKRKAEDPASKETDRPRDPRGDRDARCGSPTSCATRASSPSRRPPSRA